MAPVFLTAFGDFQHGKCFLRAAQAQGSLAFYLLLILWNKYQNRPLLGDSPEIFVLFPSQEPQCFRGSELQQSRGIGPIRWDWGLRALHPLLLLSVGSRRELSEDFWVTLPSRSGKMRFFEEP